MVEVDRQRGIRKATLLPLFLQNEDIRYCHDAMRRSRLPLSMSNTGFWFSDASGRTTTCWVSVRTCPWKVENIIPVQRDMVHQCNSLTVKGLTGLFLFAAPQIPVQVVKKPPEKFYWVSLSFQSEFAAASSTNFLQEFVGADLTLK